MDTCEFLWLISGDAKLSASVASAVRDPENQVFLSVVSFWEIALKHTSANFLFPNRPHNSSRSNAKNISSRHWLWMKPPWHN